jgi:hypothetical protein
MERLLVMRCPELFDEGDGGAVLRVFAEVVEAVGAYCPWVSAVRLGVCSLPIRGPARFFGGEPAVVELVRAAALGVDSVTAVEVGIAEGLFAAWLAAQAGVLVAPGESPAFLADWPLSVLERPELVDLLPRLGLHTLGEFACLPERHVLGRLGSEGVICHRVARGLDGELPGLRVPSMARRLDQLRLKPTADTTQPDFWAGHRHADDRAAQALTTIQAFLGAEAVQMPHLQGGRRPAHQVRLVTWAPSAAGGDVLVHSPPWPGQIPSPAPALVYHRPVRVDLVGARDVPVGLTGRGALDREPVRLSIDGGRWTGVAGWAGPWPLWERWWHLGRRGVGQLQVVTDSQLAHLFTIERDAWWLSATYD